MCFPFLIFLIKAFPKLDKVNKIWVSRDNSLAAKNKTKKKNKQKNRSNQKYLKLIPYFINYSLQFYIK